MVAGQLDQVKVAAFAAEQPIEAIAAHQQVSAGIAHERVVAGAAAQAVRQGVAQQPIGAGSTGEVDHHRQAHRRRARAGDALQLAIAIHVAHLHRHAAPLFGAGEHQGGGGGAGQLQAIDQPLVGEGAQAIEIVQTDRHLQGNADAGGAHQADAAGGGVVAVADRIGGEAGDGFQAAEAIGEAGLHPQPLAHMGLGEQQGAARAGIAAAAGERLIVGEPAGGGLPQAIEVAEQVAGAEQFALGGAAVSQSVDGHRAGGRIVAVGHRRRGQALL